MPQYVELDEIQLLAPNLGLSLSVSSHLFVSNNADLELDCQRLYDSVRAKQLWFLPPSIFYLQLKMRVGDREMHTVLPESNFLEYCANTICLSTLWDQLGLSINCTAVHYKTEHEDDPNLFFEVEQPDKSFALLSPPSVQTSTVHGLTCSLDYDWISVPIQDQRTVDSSMDIDPEECLDPDDNSIYTCQEDAWNDAHTENQTTAIESSEHFMVDEDTTKDTNSSAEYLHTVVQLALASLHKIFGVKKRFLGIRSGDPISPSLLELAPCVCNTSYIQVSRISGALLLLSENRLELFAEISAQTVAIYASHFSAIADIIADASAWRPSLLDKIVKLPTEPPDDHEEPLQYHRNDTRYAVRQNLWTLLHTSLDCNTGMRQALSRVDRSSRQLELQHSESLLFSEDTADQCNDYEMEDAIDLSEFQVWHQSNCYISPETFDWASASPYGEAGLPVNPTTELNYENQWEPGDSPANFEKSHLLKRHTQNDDDVMIDGTTRQSALHLSTDLDYDDACRTEFTHYEQQRCHNADNLAHQSLVEYGDGDEDWDDAEFEHYETSQESNAACEMAAYPPDPLI